MTKAKVLFAKHKKTYSIKLIGSIKFDSSSALEIAANEILSADTLETVLIDLMDAVNLDSSIFGVIAKLAIIVNERFNKQVAIILNNEDIYRVLLSMDFDKLFNIILESQQVQGKFNEILPISEPKRVLAERILLAHKALIQLSERNKVQFQEVVDTLTKR